MPDVRVGPLLRHVGKTDATIWVEIDEPCTVGGLGNSANTFEVEGLWQVVCSGLRKEPSAVERIVRPVTLPHFRNQIGTLEIAGGEIGVRVERVSGGWRKPRLTTVIEHKLL